MEKHPLKFAEAVNAALIVPRAVAYEFKSVQESHDVYRANIMRARSAMILPGYAFVAGEGNVFGLPQIVHLDPHGTLQEASRKIEIFCEDNWDVAWKSLEDILKNVIIHAWTAFEVLLKQLVEKSVALHPECFPHLDGTEHFSFQKREAFLKSYVKAFQDNARLQSLLTDETIDPLAELRHILIHNAGLVDADFKTRCAAIRCPDWAALPKNQPFKFTGELLWNLVDRNVKFAYDFLAAVNKWLSENKPKP